MKLYIPLVLLNLMLIGCSGSGSDGSNFDEPVSSLNNTAAALDDPLEVVEDPNTQDYLLEVTLTGDLLDDVEGVTNVYFTVLGYDNLIADVPATVIMTTTVPVKPNSETYELRFTSADLDTVEYQSGGEDGLGYYLSFFIDVDNDGQRCIGDYLQDFELLDFQFFSASDFRTIIEIPVTLVSIDAC